MNQPLAEPASPPAPRAAEAPAIRPPAAAPVSAQDVVIRVESLSKRFKLYRKPADRLVEWLTADRVRRHTDFWAVRDVSFQVRRGECLSILGVNGSGKSTLLKMVSGALYPTSGSFQLSGRVLSLIELGAGLHPQLTGRQNVFNAAQLLNFPPDFAREKLAEIEGFAELGEFFDRPIRVYSSGMKVRLAFSMFACFRPEVFVVDEALSVGDVFFQQKCVQRIDRMLEEGTTMLFVSHDLQKVRRLSDRAIVMHHGRVHFEGEPQEAVSRYTALESLAGRKPEAADGSRRTPAAPPAQAPGPHAARQAIIQRNILPPSPSRHGSGDLRVEAVSFENDQGQPALVVRTLGAATIRALVRARHRVAEPTVGVHLYDRLGNLVFAANTRQLGVELGPLEPGQERLITFRLTLAVQPGPYTFSIGCGERAPDDRDSALLHDRVENLGPVQVLRDPSGPHPFFGIAQLPLEITV